MFHLFTVTWKIAFASLLVGAGLRAFDITAIEILQRIGLTPERLLSLTQEAVAWALPNILLGSIVIVPLWCLGYMLRPPRG